jgi:hypothetical protein
VNDFDIRTSKRVQKYESISMKSGYLHICVTVIPIVIIIIIIISALVLEISKVMYNEIEFYNEL